MDIRKTTSLTLILSFALLVLTSLVLYVVPEGRVAYWSDWRWLGLSKTQWGDIHTNSGFLFLAAGLIHLWYNWKAIMSYLRNRARQMRIVTPAFIAALLLNLIVLGGTLLHLPPFSSILEFGRSFKEAAAVKYGEPPYGHAERSSLALFAKRTELDLASVKAGLKKAGINFSSDTQTILDIAKANHITPKTVFDAMQMSKANTSITTPSLPEQPFPGMGRMTLKEFCIQFGLDQERIISILVAKGIKAAPEKTFKEIAGEHGTDPHTLFALIHEAAQSR
jgi:hypothetical protein